MLTGQDPAEHVDQMAAALEELYDKAQWWRYSSMFDPDTPPVSGCDGDR